MLRFAPLSSTGLAIAALLGCSVVQAAPVLPPWPIAALVSTVSLFTLVLTRCEALRYPCAVMLFGSWAALHGVRDVAARWPTDREGTDVTLVGRITELPRRVGADVSFVFLAEPGLDAIGTPAGKLRLTWFRAERPPRACERWRLTVRLRRPRGSVNPGGNDAERMALQKGIDASGYVRASSTNALLASGNCVNGWRAQVAQALDRHLGSRDARIVKALAVGDTRGLDASDWDIARATGVSHLIAISGFHVGVAAGGGTLAIRLLYACLPWLGLWLPRAVAQVTAGFVVAGMYGLLAGMGLPTVRTLLMIAVVVLATWRRRRASGTSLLALAVLAMLAVAPLSVLSAGFWLSFAGVAFLMLCVAPRARGWRGWLGELVRAQAAMSLILLPMSLWWFGTASVAGFVANLIAAPLVSFVVVPLSLVGCATLAWPTLASPLLTVAAWTLSWLWQGLAAMSHWPGARLGVADGGLVPVLLATLGAAWLFVPRGVPLRGYGALLCLPLALPPRETPAPGAFRIWVLDVGQGLSVLVRTRTHTLVYDTGPAYAAGHDAGVGVVLPAVTALGIAPIDTMVISHGDQDHAGGGASVAARYPQAARLSGEPRRLRFSADRCTPEQSWSWDDVHFHFLVVPSDPSGKTSGNDRSCVLAVEGAGGRLLLTGDISARAERRIDVDALVSDLPTVTTVAHHGSKHSSGAGWLAAVDPVIAVASAGYRNRFGHPHPSVVKRYEAVGAAVFNTASSGAVRIDFPADGEPMITREWRRSERRYWRE